MKLLLLDIETAPNKVYSWGLWNQNIAINQIEEAGYTICWAAKWHGEKVLHYSSLHTDTKKDMLSQVYYLMDEADAIIHYNGTRFDIPTLNQEFLFMDWAPPAPSINIDLYLTAKRRFRLPSNSLNYVSNVLGLGEKTKHKGMELWKECMAGNKKAWSIMEVYNKNDVILLEKVYEKLLPWIPNHPNRGLIGAGEEMMCPNCGSKHLHKRGHYYTNTLSYQRYQCQDCGTWSRARTTELSLEKRRAVLKGVV